MTEAKELETSKDQGSASSHCSSRAFRVGDCVILNYCEEPCGRLVAVVVKDDGENYYCRYLNADPVFDSYNNPPMKSRLADATKVEDFGVSIRYSSGEFWCRKDGESKATYGDGKPRRWQEHSGPVHHYARANVAELVWPF